MSKFLVVLATPLYTIGATTLVIDQNFAGLVVTTVGFVGVIIAVMNWIDKRIEHKLRNHAQFMLLEIDIFRVEMGLERRHPHLQRENLTEKGT